MKNARRIAILQAPVCPGESYTLECRVVNEDPSRGYDLANYFGGNWQIIEQCQITVTTVTTGEKPVTTGEKPVEIFKRSFTANDTIDVAIDATIDMIDMTEMKVRKTAYCMAIYTIPPSGIYFVEIKVQVREDAPPKHCEEVFWWVYQDIYPGVDNMDTLGVDTYL